MNCFTVIASIFLMLGIAHCLPEGAPNTCCEAMVPGHEVDEQTGASPNFSTVPNTVNINYILYLFVIVIIINNYTI